VLFQMMGLIVRVAPLGVLGAVAYTVRHHGVGSLSWELRAMGYRKLSARPRHHAQAEGAIETFKKSSQRAWMKSRAKKQSTSAR
jgi:hypothetical protein